MNNYLELLGFISGIIGVWLASKENIWNWLVGIINVSIYIVVFFQAKLYADMFLQVFYVFMGIYGWIEWGKRKNKLKIENCKLKTVVFLVLASAIAFALVTVMLKKTDSNVPYLDSITTVLSLAGTWMMAKKLLENWLVWILVDSVYVFLYIYKNLYLTALLYFAFTLLAIYGYFEWKKMMRKINA